MTPAARLRAILGGSAGNLVEWFDWFAYTSFSIYFAKTFFPKGDPLAQWLQASVVFAVGFLARPVGAWAMGVMTDRVGRRAALAAGVLMMSVGSLMVGLLPGYATIGPWAPVLLTLARLVQGFSAGGEYGASATYLSEVAGSRHRGFWSSFQFFTIIGGQLGAMLLLMALQATVGRPGLEAWAWRLPFFVGAGLGLLTWIVQLRLEETEAFRAAHETSSPWRIFTHYPRETLIVFAMSSAGGLAFYTYSSFMLKFLTKAHHFSDAAATRIVALALVFYLALMPLFGWLGDVVGRKRLLAVAFGASAVLAWPTLSALEATRDATAATLLIGLGVLALAGYSAVNAVVKAELYPTGVRGLGVALPYALGNAVFGGTAEMIALWFAHRHQDAGFYAYASGICAMAFLAVLALPDLRRLEHLTGD